MLWQPQYTNTVQIPGLVDKREINVGRPIKDKNALIQVINHDEVPP